MEITIINLILVFLIGSIIVFILRIIPFILRYYIVNKFVSMLNSKFKDLDCYFKYNRSSSEFDIIYKNNNYNLSNEYFVEYTGELIQKLLYKNNIFNITIGFEY